ncbi:hypothetical protein Glove_294g64 [Diversispora epigaea]|uniref:Uncharacterized protein n=1 Tax=Diversispora epigaea TaxID=1348612 RepID=A0A397I4E4_9GLOM|nr:hypothetical protein Glove_294g64 [Diversispora epigaea]
MSNYGILNFILKAEIVLFQSITFLDDLYRLSIKFQIIICNYKENNKLAIMNYYYEEYPNNPVSSCFFTSGAITNGAIKKSAILLEKIENSRTKFYTSSQLTPDQKRELLFNVDQPFEIPMCEFDEECTIYQVCIKKGSQMKNDEKLKSILPDYTHTIGKSEKLKHSQFVQNLVEQEAIKNYPPPTIVNAIKEYAIEKLDFNFSVKELRRKEVTNIKSKVYKSQNIYLTGNINLELDIKESVVFFKNQEYQVECFQILY